MNELTKIDNVISLKYGGENLRDYVKALKLYSKRLASIDNSLAYTAAIGHMHGRQAT